MELIEKKVGKNAANKRMTDTFAPRLTGARIGSENYTKIMDEEREKLKLGEKTVKLVDTLIDKLLHDDDDYSSRGFFGEIVDRIKSKMPQKAKNKGDGEGGKTE